ncbi:ankyrin repeat-containing domain protein [Trichoderma sp. SZMC 28013]
MSSKERKRHNNRIAQRTYSELVKDNLNLDPASDPLTDLASTTGRNQKLRMQALEAALASTGRGDIDNLVGSAVTTAEKPQASLTQDACFSSGQSLLSPISVEDLLVGRDLPAIQSGETPGDYGNMTSNIGLQVGTNSVRAHHIDETIIKSKKLTYETQELIHVDIDPPWLQTPPSSSVANACIPTSTQQRPALHRAILKGDVNMCRLLLDKGADIHRLTSDGMSTLQLAVESHSLDLVSKFIDKCSGIVDVKNGIGRTALFSAVESKDADLVGLLIRSGVDVNCADHNGVVALHLAVDMGLDRITCLLLENGADIDA